MNDVTRISALANESRLAVMRWLKEPRKHFPHQPHGDVDELGVCCTFITEKLRIAPATTTRHMRILADAGLVRATRIGKFTYYKRIDAELKKLSRDLSQL
ncbi:ArsR/SmtB family transcription factor [Paraburkholderia caballeronis]|uniref:Transcriptional regulator, ArsR family n=1 Tax=Paraburkholderia caballeronis TaxID=416943 RepID=A0A1H7FBP1_9BURK|nr:helix-turn-helix domain-containing protein [Paraburkholderia caballeronis]PXW24064.1 ArsR family transcriptional regulator [Paraburkholderia caballeronis]PXW99828.1 ArsR family transcriptional regulator [Paraburkholderia caballeronis]RAJ96782.1 ArsR family transcriptional regulator [Paraburkholderia caballeronis]TDV15816.1 ArsR family transcriptional regulator [Paraburkholderia caballeronis]TDV18071.1 ArsR family transcriptional regulator [Paraburkholderia caballeronis]